MIKIKRLDHIQICIPSDRENEAREFYTNIMGFKEISRPVELIPNGGLWYQVEEIQFYIGTEIEVNRSKRHPAFEIIDLASARKHLERNGVKIKKENQIPGKIRFSFMGPFDNRIELLQKS